MRRPLLVAVGVTFLAFVGLYYLLPYISPFIIALIAASLLDPIVTFLEKVGIRRSVACFVLVFGTFAGLLGIVAVFLSALWQEINQLQYASGLLQASSEWITHFRKILGDLPFPASEIGPVITDRINTGLAEAANAIVRWAAAIPDGIFIWLISALTAYFICKDKRTIGRFLYKHLPKPWRTWLFQLKHEMMVGVLQYSRVQLILVSVSTVLTIVFFFLLGIRYAIVLGLLAGFLDILPGVGPTGVYIPIVIYQFWNGRYDLAFACLAAWLILFLVRQIWEPRLVSSQLGLHPLTTIIALYIGVKVMGAPGILLGPFLVIFAKALYQIAVE